MSSILIVDDDINIQLVLTNLLKMRKFNVKAVSSIREAMDELTINSYDLIILDIFLPDGNGIECLKNIKKINNDIQVIILTAYGEIKYAVEAIKNGAADYLTKPLSNEEILLTIQKILDERKLAAKLEYLKNESESKFKEYVLASDVIKKIFQQAKQIAKSKCNILLEGETGVGKEVLAYWLHQNSSYNKGPYIVVDCSVLPKDIAEIELFGYEKGAFTGADKKKIGKIELADGGSLFLDEIGNLPLELQPKLLRVLEEKSFFRVGGTSLINVDVRFIFASNEHLEELVEKSLFRKDLYYRIAEFKIVIPPLRERKDDIIPLAEYFLKKTNLELNKNVSGITDRAKRRLLEYSWPGNIRELKNLIRFAVFIADDVVDEEHLDIILKNTIKKKKIQTVTSEKFENLNLDKKIAEVEKETIIAALQQAKNNKQLAANYLGISRKALYEKMRKYNIEI